MTRDEVKRLIGLMSQDFPNTNITNPAGMIDAWMFHFSECNVEDVLTAYQIFVQTQNSSFAPTPSQLFTMMNKVDELSELSDSEAWALVEKGIHNGNYNSVESFENFPIEIQMAVGSSSYLKDSANDPHINWGYERAQFIKNYQSVLRRKREVGLLPQKAKERLMSGTKEKLIESKS